MSRLLLALAALLVLPAAAAAGGRVGARTPLVAPRARPRRLVHPARAELGTLPFFGHALLVAVDHARSATSANVYGLIVPARIAPENAAPLVKRRATTLLPLHPAADPLVRAALKATGLDAEVRVVRGQ